MSQETPYTATPAVMAGATAPPGAQVPGAAAPGTDARTDAGVEAALGLLDGLDDLLPADHVTRFEQVHDALRAHLNGDAAQ